MKQAFSKIFWGYLLALIEINIIVIDILADPVGYFLIFSGVTMLLKEFPNGHKAAKLSLALVFISIPTVFIPQNTGSDPLGQISILSGWSLYMIVLGLLKLILVFYVFQLIMKIVHQHGNDGFISRASNTFTIYVIVMLLINIYHAFTINFSARDLMPFSIITIITSLIMDIVFLFLLRSMRNIRSEEE